MTNERWQRVKALFQDTVEQPLVDREAFLAAAAGKDEELRREVDALLAADAADVSVLDRFLAGSGGVVDGAMILSAVDEAHVQSTLPCGHRIGAYEVVAPLGAGGMGTVYLAERVTADFRQQAAIKIVRAGVADELLFRRFQDERRILAAFDHPHIAHLIDGGATEGGLPYVVMEYVDGRPIDRYCDELALDVRQRLDLFRLVCLAVHYAHQRLVVHRDIKASNILVTADGVPKLLDFGIAKILEQDHPGELTRTNCRALTPENASPEQLRGEPITIATDVYGLGMLLYRLLTGGSPYHVSTASQAELIRAICEQPPTPPSAAPRSQSGQRGTFKIDRDLDRIVLMALRKEPERRYGTAEQLAEDVRRYLAGRPIVAGPDSAVYRARKFVGRNRVVVAAGLGFLVAVTGGIATTTWQAQVARQERNRAQRQFNAVRSLSGSVFGELHDAVAPLPGSLAVRELLVRRAMEYLDSLAADTGEDASLRQELALGYTRLGRLQGVAGFPNLGDRAAARRSLERAAALFESLDTQAMNVNAGVGAIDTYTGLAVMVEDETSRAIHLSKARRLIERLSREAPSDVRVLMAANVVWFHIGNDQERSKDYGAALQSFTNEASAAESWLALKPDSGDASRDLSLAYKKMATQHELQGDADAAIALYTKALELDRARVDRAPNRGLWRLDLSFSHGEIGSLLLKMGRAAEALEHHRQAIELRRAVVAGSPDDDFAQTSLARGYESLASTLSGLGDVDAAIQANLDGISVLDRRRTAHPDRDHAWREQIWTMMAAATFCLDLLDRTRGPALSARARHVRGILERVARLQAEWAREKRSGELPPTKPELERALQRCDRLIG